MRREARATVVDPKEDRTRRIVETAIALAERDGYDAVRLRDVAAQANVALGTVYRRFTSKEDILVAALEHEIASVQEPLADATRSGSAIERVNAVFHVLTEHLLEREHLARALLRAVASGVPDVAEKVTRFHSLVIELIASIADADPIAGDAHEDTRRELSRMVQNIWFAELVGWASGLHTKEELLAEMDRATDVILRGLLTK
jgi:TetR/AcrR family transcriptional regulator, cholesterol catabolism regulator